MGLKRKKSGSVETSAALGFSETASGTSEDIKHLRSLKRQELLEIMLRQQKQIDELKAQLAKANAELDKRQIKFARAGSLADAVLEINGVAEAAQQASEDYIKNIMYKVDGVYEQGMKKGGGNGR